MMMLCTSLMVMSLEVRAVRNWFLRAAEIFDDLFAFSRLEDVPRELLFILIYNKNNIEFKLK